MFFLRATLFLMIGLFLCQGFDFETLQAIQIEVVVPEIGSDTSLRDRKRHPIEKEEVLFDLIEKGKFDEFRSQLKDFYNSTRSELAELYATHENNSIAIQGIWTLVRYNGLGHESDVSQALKYDASYFVSAFENRNRILMPAWWYKVVLETSSAKKVVWDIPTNLYTHTGLIRCAPGVSIIEQEGKVTLRERTNSIVIPEEILERNDEGDLVDNIAVNWDENACYLTVYTDPGYQHRLVCIDRNTNEIKWSKIVLSSIYSSFGASGRSKAFVSIHPTADGRVFVYGSVLGLNYAHGFRKDDGRTIFFFNTQLSAY